MNNMPYIAVLLAAHNGKPWIMKQVESILYQEKVRLDLYINVDLSEDDTYLWCKELSNKISNVHVLSYGEKYGCASNNFFRLINEVSFEKYDYISLADQDDIWLHNKLSQAIISLETEKADGYSSNVIAFWNNGKSLFIKKSYQQKKFDHYFESAGPGCTYVLRKESFEKFKFFLHKNLKKSKNIGTHDWLIYAYFRSFCMKWIIDDNAYLLYRQHDRNQIGVNYGMRAYFNRLSKVWLKKYRKDVEKIIDLLGHKYVYEFSLDTHSLLRHINQLRRRPRDVLILFLMIILKIF